jgi:hypothetical protein
MKRKPMAAGRRQNTLTALAAVTSLIVLAGCSGGSGAGTSGSSSTAAASRAQVATWNNQVLEDARMFGTPDGTGDLAAASATTDTGGIPCIAYFLKNVAVSDSANLHVEAILGGLKDRGVGGGGHHFGGFGFGFAGQTGSGTSTTTPTARFYYDRFLQLWVQSSYATGSSRYDLYTDEAKTTSAGYIATTYPSDWTTYPLTWTAHYEFTAGAESGAHGDHTQTVNADQSYTYQYTFVGADGSKRTGSGSGDGTGASTWTQREESSDGTTWTQSDASFKSDHSGTLHVTSSTGYDANYTYNADGSGSAIIKGSASYLPATVTWTAAGVVTVTYADGTTQTFQRWGRHSN